MKPLTRRVRMYLIATVFASACSDATATDRLALLVVDRTSLSVGLGETAQINAFAFALSGERIDSLSKLEWKSSNASIATVDEHGLVHGIALGSARVTVSRDGKTATADVDVVPASVVISPHPATLNAGATVQLSAKAYDAAGTELSAGTTAWSIGSTTIAAAAQVSSTGLFSALAPSLVRVDATIAGKKSSIDIGIPSPFDGEWSGNDALGFPVRVTVEYGSVTAFAMPNVVLPECTTRQFAATINAPIVNAQFTAALLAPSGSVAGSFTPSSLTGTRGAVYLGIFACDNKIQTNPHTLESASFIATR